MANLYRLILGFILACVSLSSFALVPKVGGYRSTDYQLGTFSTPDGACSAILDFVNTVWGGGGTLTGCSETVAYVVRDGSAQLYQFTIAKVTDCPENSSDAGGGQCQCVTNYEEKDGQCRKTDPVADFCAELPGAQYSNQEVVTGSSVPPSFGCTPTIYTDQTTRGCGGTFQREFSAQQDGKWYHFGTLTLTGGTCNLVEGATGENPDGTTPTDAAPPVDDRKCPNGFPGTVNGIETCVPYSGQNGVGVSGGTTTTTNPDGSVTTTTTQAQTSCTGASCTTTTTTTTTTGGGTPSTTTTSTTTTRNEFCRNNPIDPVCTGSATGGVGTGDGNGEGNGFCKENPGSPICKQSSFSGSCAASFVCDGDAIQCAIAKEQHIRACKMFDDPSPESQLYEANKGKEGNQTGDNPNNETVSLTGRIDTSDALGGGACIPDLNVTVWGQSFTLPFSTICPSLAMLGNLLVAVSMLLSARIVTRG